MKWNTFIIWAIFFGMPAAAQETDTDVKLKTDVAEATVFIKGAQVTRKTTANFPAGRSTVRFVNLSPYIDAKSVQVKVDGDVMVLSVNLQMNSNDTVKLSAEKEQLRAKLREWDEKIKIENAVKEALNQELNFLTDNRKIGGDNGIDINNLKAASTYYGERFAALKLKEIEIDRKIRSLTSERNDIEHKISLTGTAKPEPSGEVVLNIDCKTATRVPVELSYYVNNVGWYPSYDIRARSIAEPIELVYKANVMQNTKETWRNVHLKVSSVNPNLGNVPPKLKTYRLDYYTRPPRYDADNLTNQVGGRVTDDKGEPIIGATVTIKGTTIGTLTDESGRYSLAIPEGGGELIASYIGYRKETKPIIGNNINIILEEEQVMLDEVVVVGYGSERKYGTAGSVSVNPKKQITASASIPIMQVENATSFEFEIKTRYSIPSENRNTTIEIARYTVPAEYEYYSIPKIESVAFLLASISGWEQYNLLEGEANIFFENTFIGKTILDVRSLGDTLNLSLGRDKNITVKRDKVREYSAQRFLGSKTETTRDWKIIVRNNKRQPVAIAVFDQIPVSTLQEIDVSTENLSGGSLNNETGEVKWKLTLPPSQSRELDLKYKVKHPKGKALLVE